MIRSAKVADLIGRASSYGVAIERATVDMQGVRQRKREMVDGIIAIHRKKLRCRISSSCSPKAGSWGLARPMRDFRTVARAALAPTASS